MAKSLFIFLFLFFSFGLTIHKKCRKVLCHGIKSYEECGKIVHRPCSSCISSVQEINENSIEFFLSTWTWSRFKSSWLEPYTRDPDENLIYCSPLDLLQGQVLVIIPKFGTVPPLTVFN